MSRQQMRENLVARASTVPAVQRETRVECGAWLGAEGGSKE